LSPRLTLDRAGTNATVSWIIPSKPLKLQQSLGLNPPDWNDVLAQPIVTNYWKQITMPMTNGSGFYQLRNF